MNLSRSHQIVIALCCIAVGLPVRAQLSSHVKDDRRVRVFAINDIEAGHRIDDTDLQEMATRQGNIKGLLYCRNQAVNHKAKATIQVGQILAETDLDGPVTFISDQERCMGTTVVALTHSVQAGQILSARDVTLKSVDPFSAGHVWMARPDFVIGFKANHALTAGTVLSPDDLSPTEDCLRNHKRMASVYGPAWKDRSDRRH